jgi:regulatory protein
VTAKKSSQKELRQSIQAASSKLLDRQSIEEKALGYLNRFDASASRLRRLLEQFVRKRADELGTDAEPYLTIVSETIDRYRASGLVDDRRYGATMARNLAERGASRQAIKSKLFGRGVESNVIEAVVGELAASGASELDAARALVRKRHLGNYRPEGERRANHRRDLGVLARAGFSFDIARQALGLEGADEDF